MSKPNQLTNAKLAGALLVLGVSGALGFHFAIDPGNATATTTPVSGPADTEPARAPAGLAPAQTGMALAPAPGNTEAELQSFPREYRSILGASSEKFDLMFHHERFAAVFPKTTAGRRMVEFMTLSWAEKYDSNAYPIRSQVHEAILSDNPGESLGAIREGLNQMATRSQDFQSDRRMAVQLIAQLDLPNDQKSEVLAQELARAPTSGTETDQSESDGFYARAAFASLVQLDPGPEVLRPALNNAMRIYGADATVKSDFYMRLRAHNPDLALQLNNEFHLKAEN